MTIRILAAAAALGAAAGASTADITWLWSFNDEAGTFVTDGSLVGGSASPGNYVIQDFSVTASGVGAELGSLSGGQYTQGNFSSDPPYTLVWDGSSVTQWLQSGGNTFDWHPYQSTSDTNANYFFAWEDANIHNPDLAAYWVGGDVRSNGEVTVRPVPAPASLAALGLAGLAGARRRR